MAHAYYQQRIERVLQFIDKHYAQPLNTERIADIACLSPYHWHRIFIALTGESIGQRIRRVRLHKSTLLLKQGISITRVAKKVGYTHIDSYIRAFKDTYNTTPHAYRAGQCPHALPPPIPLTSPLVSQETTLEMCPMLCLWKSAEEQDFSKIQTTINMVTSHLFAFNMMTPQSRFFSIYYHDPGITYRKHSAWTFAISDLVHLSSTTPLTPYTLQKGIYLTYEHRGPYDLLFDVWQYFYNHLIQRTDIQIRAAPYFEEYLNSPSHTAAHALRTKLYLPVTQIA